MRSIKFRAWDKKSKKMRIIDSIAFHGLGHFDIPTLDIKLINLWGYDIIEDKYFIIRRDPEQVKLLQYTGLTDKNGKEIYEGDVIQLVHPFKDRQYTGKIIFEGGSFIAEDFWMTHYDNPSDFTEGLEHVEVIGNIFEDGELLNDSNPPETD